MASKKNNSKAPKKVLGTCSECGPEQESIMILFIGAGKKKAWCCKNCHAKGVHSIIKR